MRVSATDVDEGDNQKITYDLMAKTFEADIEYFRYHLFSSTYLLMIPYLVGTVGTGTSFLTGSTYGTVPTVQ